MGNAPASIFQQLRDFLRRESLNINLPDLSMAVDFVAYGTGRVPPELNGEIYFDKTYLAAVFNGTRIRIHQLGETRSLLAELIEEYQRDLALGKITTPVELPLQLEIVNDNGTITFGPAIVLNSTMKYEDHLRRLNSALGPIPSQPSFMLSNDEHPLAVFDAVRSKIPDLTPKIQNFELDRQKVDCILEKLQSSPPSVSFDEMALRIIRGHDTDAPERRGNWFILTEPPLKNWAVVKRKISSNKIIHIKDLFDARQLTHFYFHSNKDCINLIPRSRDQLEWDLAGCIKIDPGDRINFGVVDLTYELIHSNRISSRSRLDISVLLYVYLNRLVKSSVDVVSTVDVASSFLSSFPEDHTLRERMVFVR